VYLLCEGDCVSLFFLVFLVYGDSCVGRCYPIPITDGEVLIGITLLCSVVWWCSCVVITGVVAFVADVLWIMLC
jgi:hypothetical protein